MTIIDNPSKEKQHDDSHKNASDETGATHWSCHFWARGYLAVNSEKVTYEMIQQYIEEQEGEPLYDDSRSQIDNP